MPRLSIASSIDISGSSDSNIDLGRRPNGHAPSCNRMKRLSWRSIDRVSLTITQLDLRQDRIVRRSALDARVRWEIEPRMMWNQSAGAHSHDLRTVVITLTRR